MTDETEVPNNTNLPNNFGGISTDPPIFVYDVENVVKVRTGEEGYAALQDED